jgi:hypothetical protein
MLDRGEWSASCFGHFTPGKTPRKLGGSQTSLDTEEDKNFLPLPGIKQFICAAHASHYTDYALLAPIKQRQKNNLQEHFVQQSFKCNHQLPLIKKKQDANR